MHAPTGSTGTPSTAELDGLRAVISGDLPDYLVNLERLVNIDCGSYTPTGVDQVGRWTGDFLAELGAEVEHRPDPDGRLGATVVATFHGQAGGPQVLMIGHLDTVFDPGTAAARPFRMEDGVAHGPGVTDMKSGLLAGLHALKALIGERGGLPFERLVFVANPDEEIGSPSSTPHIQRDRRRGRRRARPRVRPRQRRHRLGAQGDPRIPGCRSTAAPPTPASSPRRGAARFSKPPGS